MMQRFILLIITVCLLSASSPTTKQTEKALSEVERLYLTCKIWGFLKYYHPLVGKGSFDWDEKLVSVLNKTRSIQTYEEYADYMARWIYYMGERPPCRSCNQPSSEELFLENFDLSWTQSADFSGELRKALKDIERNRFQGDHHYIGQGKVGQFEPKNEPQHYDLDWQNRNQRMIPLFRFWNYIEYFFPYKYQTEQDWDEVLKEMIPKFLDINSKLDFHLAILEMVVKVDDSHAGILTPTIEKMPYYNYLPARIEMIENQAVVTEIIDEAKSRELDLQVGDVIRTVNGQTVQELHNSNKKYIWGSNDAVKDRSIYHTLFMGLNGTADITIERDQAISSRTVSLYSYSDLSYEAKKGSEKWKTIEDSIGYVNLGVLTTNDVDGMMTELMDKKAIVFDVRNYPKGTMYKIANYLNPMPSGFAIFTKPMLNYPGKFTWTQVRNCGKENPDYYTGEVILLINETTQNHGEFTCMCLQTAPNVTIIGSQTAGADGTVTKFPLIQRFYSAFTGIGVLYPDGTEAQRIGIVPDFEVKPTIEGIRAGKDEVLDQGVTTAKEIIVRKAAELRAQLAAELRAQQIAGSLAMDSLAMDSIQVAPIEMDSTASDGDW